MALINCRECNREISNQAASCPQCGSPIAIAKESAAAGADLITTQLTSKKFKKHTLLAMLVAAVGLVISCSQFAAMDPEADPSGSLLFGSLLLWVGGIWYVVTRIRIWWHHH